MTVEVAAQVAAGEAARPLVYAGRFARGLGERADVTVLDDVEVGPRQLLAAVERAPLLVILDPLSFPYETLRSDDWDCPFIVCLPARWGFTDVLATLGSVLLERLGFFDLLVTDDDGLWDALRQRYSLATSQRLDVDPEAAAAVVDEAVRLRAGDVQVEAAFANPEVDSVAYWSERGEALADLVPHRAIGSLHHDLRANKAMHRLQARSLRQQVEAARRAQPRTRSFAMLEVGTGVGRWAGLANRGAEFVGTDVSAAMVAAASANFPQYRFEHLAADDLRLPFARERFDVAFSVTVLHHNPPELKRKLIAHMWRVLRPGGRLLFLEDFVTSRTVARATVFPMSVGEFVELVLDATRGQIVLEHVEALRYPHDDLHRTGLITMSKVGVPRAW